MMTQDRTNRVNLLLDDEHAIKLHRLPARTYVQPRTIARSLLSTAPPHLYPPPRTLPPAPASWRRPSLSPRFRGSAAPSAGDRPASGSSLVRGRGCSSSTPMTRP